METERSEEESHEQEVTDAVSGISVLIYTHLIFLTAFCKFPNI